MLGMLGLLLIFVMATVSIQMTLTTDQIGSSTSALNLWATTLFPEPWASLGVLALVSSTVATVQTTLLPSVRTAFSMGRDRTLGKVWTEVHPRFRTPFYGTVLMFAIIAVISIVDLKAGKLNNIVTAGVTAIGILVSFYYGLAGIACAVYYRKRALRGVGAFLAMFLFPLASGVTLWALAGYLIQQDWTNPSYPGLAFEADNTKFQALVPILVILSGIPVLIFSRLRYRSDFWKSPRAVAPAMPAALPAPAGGGGGGH
jgi:amino acid transporter